jgi:DHA3 family macrolide efflux protein-like MFS transporter
MISSSVMPVGMLVFGPVADAVKIEWLLIVTGVLLFALSFMLVGSRPLVEAGEAKASPSSLSSPSSPPRPDSPSAGE